jgi:hypothetical protein
MQRKVDWVDVQRCRARRTAHGWVESWSRGQKSQLASRTCSGGVSAVMGTSDFDEHTFAQRGPVCHRCKGALPSTAKPPKVETTCLSTAAEVKPPGKTGRGLLLCSVVSSTISIGCSKECRTLEMTFQALASKPRLTPINLDGCVRRWRS